MCTTYWRVFCVFCMLRVVADVAKKIHCVFLVIFVFCKCIIHTHDVFVFVGSVVTKQRRMWRPQRMHEVGGVSLKSLSTRDGMCVVL